MNITAQLDQLSTTEKLRTMEYLWDDLCRHADGSAVFRDWEVEKSRILDSLTQEASCN